jgi:hypothetical protein
MLYCSLEEARIVLFQVLRSFLRLRSRPGTDRIPEGVKKKVTAEQES